MDGFEGEPEDFITYSLADWEPVELLQDGGDVMGGWVFFVLIWDPALWTSLSLWSDFWGRPKRRCGK